MRKQYWQSLYISATATSNYHHGKRPRVTLRQHFIFHCMQLDFLSVATRPTKPLCETHTATTKEQSPEQVFITRNILYYCMAYLTPRWLTGWPYF